MKRLLLFLSALMLSIAALWAHDVEIGGIYYNLYESDKVAEVTYYGNYYESVHNEYSGSVTIPETITYNSEIYSVTSIGSSAFRYCSGLTSVTIPNSVTSIGDDAFSSCSGLTEILFSSNNEEFSSENGVLYNKDKTTLIQYPAGKKDTSFTIPNSVTSIGSWAFDGCSGLTSVTIGESVTSIGFSAFCDCSGLTKVNYLGTVDKWVEIDFNFSNSNPTYYADDLYINNELLTDVKITSADSIKNYAFCYCKSIKSVEIDNSVTSIGYGAFFGCSGLTSVTIPNSVTSIGSDAFFGCSGLTSVTIPNSVTSIGSGAFYKCSGLTSVTIPNSVASIGSFAFSDCSGLTSVTIPNSVTSIDYKAFYGCSRLTEVTIPNSVTSIGKYAFGGSSALTKVNYLGTVDEWAKFDWYHSSYNPTYYANDLYINGELLTDVKITSADSIKQYAFYNCKSIKSVEIGNSVKSIGESAFSGCSGLNSVLIGDSVTSIESYAFNGCSNLTSIVIPKNVKSIRYNVFKYCKNLKSIYNCSGVDILVDFETPPVLESPGEGKTTLALFIPNSACEEAIPYAIGDMPGDGQWRNQESLKMTRCEGKSEWWHVTVDALTPENATNFKFRMEDGNGGWSMEPTGSYELLEDAAEYIQIKTDEIYNLFATANCNNKVLYIESGKWSITPCEQTEDNYYVMPGVINACPIGDFIFNYEDEIIEYIGDTTVNKIEIPEFVKGIEADVFAHCKNLNKITILSNEVPNAYISSFAHYNAYLYVPCDVHEDYDLDYVFGNFKYIKCISAEEVEGSDKVEIEVDSNNNATIIWPSTDGANSYELLISKDGEVFCTLLFNENGQLTSIDFGNRSASVGFQFTVTGLDAASKYSYSIVAKDEKGNELESYNGTFTTNGYSEVTAILETLADANITISGGLITCSDAEFTIYNTLGQDVTAYNGSLQPGVYVVSIAEDVVKVMMK